MNVKRYNYRDQLGQTLPSLVSDLQRMLADGEYILTREVSEFETAFGQYLDVKYVRGVNSGTDALLIALLALGLREGDEVITQANTFNATVAAIRFAGAKPVLVDANEPSYLINDDQIESVITERTRVIIPVHLFGKPTPMMKILSMAKKYGLAVVEDAAQAHGARIHGKRVGSFGTIGCFSFHPSKNLAAAGDAGAVVTNDATIDMEMKRRRELGQEGQNCHVVLGMNSKLDAIQARILSHKLQHLDGWNESRRRVAGWYRKYLEGLPLGFQELHPDEEHVFHLMQIRTNRRNPLLDYLRLHEVDATIRYPVPVHLQAAFADQGWRKGQFPVAERLCDELLCLPIRPDMSTEEVEYVADCIRAFFREQ